MKFLPIFGRVPNSSPTESVLFSIRSLRLLLSPTNPNFYKFGDSEMHSGRRIAPSSPPTVPCSILLQLQDIAFPRFKLPSQGHKDSFLVLPLWYRRIAQTCFYRGRWDRWYVAHQVSCPPMKPGQTIPYDTHIICWVSQNSHFSRILKHQNGGNLCPNFLKIWSLKIYSCR